MVERERGVERQDADREAVEVVAHPAEFEPTAADRDAAQSTPAVSAEEERHRRVMASAERVMRKHRGVFAVLAK